MNLQKLLVCIAIFAFYASSAGPVTYYGKLKVNGNKLTGSNTGADNAVQLRGVSLGWSNTGWESASFFHAVAVNAMIEDWKADIVRVPLGYEHEINPNEPYYNGYRRDPSNWTRVKTAVNAAIAKGVYVIIDFHSHNAEVYTAAAKEFFENTVSEYHNNPHVIFELYNEPIDQSWSTIKNYAETIINAIRGKGADNLILVGTRGYSRRVDEVIPDPISDNNVAYVLHFYAQNHYLNRYSYQPGDPTFKEVIQAALDANLHIFISEYGTVNGSGAGPHHKDNSDEWLEFLDEKKLSSCAWHVNNKNEGAAFFTPNFIANTSNTDYTNRDRMTPSGEYIFDKLNEYALTAEWRNPTPILGVKPALRWNMQISGNTVVLQVHSGTLKLEIFDLRGKSLKTQTFSSGNWTVPLNYLSQGIYYVRASLGSESHILRVAVK
jgi:endoglucanase